MVMGLCLLVYSLGQRALRQALERAKQTIDNQLGKPTTTPTDALGVSMFYVDSFGHSGTNQTNCQLNPGTALDSPVFWCPLSKILSGVAVI
jgi:hypothetical protein